MAQHHKSWWPLLIVFQANYAKKKNLGGLMFWTIDDDDFTGECDEGRRYPIISSVWEVLMDPEIQESDYETSDPEVENFEPEPAGREYEEIPDDGEPLLPDPNELDGDVQGTQPAVPVIVTEKPSSVPTALPTTNTKPPTRTPAKGEGRSLVEVGSFPPIAPQFSEETSNPEGRQITILFPNNVYFQNIKSWVVNHFHFQP